MKFLEDANYLSERSHQVFTIADPDSKIAREYPGDRSRLITMKCRSYIDLLASYKLQKLFRNHDISAVHIHRSQDLGPVLLAADFARVQQRVLTLRMESEKAKFDPYHKWIYKRLTTLLTITERMRDTVRKTRPISANRVQCLYNGIDVDNLKQGVVPREKICKRWNVNPDSFIIGIVGRLDPLKGQQVVLKATSELKVRIPGLVLFIVGDESQNEKGELKILWKLTDDLGIKDRVIFTGHQTPPGSIVPAFNVSIMATRKETFGNVAVEALALGVPVIATNAGGAPEIVDHEKTGLLFEPDNHVDLAEAILKLYKNSSLREKMGKLGEKIMPERFSMDRHILNLERALKGEEFQ